MFAQTRIIHYYVCLGAASGKECKVFMKIVPTGIENFKELIDKDAYYVDKSNLIEEVLKEKVVLYTRPRRFGKTLNMSMLYYFFSNKEKENATYLII